MLRRSDGRRRASAAPPCLSAMPWNGNVEATESKSAPDFGGYARLHNSIARQRRALAPEKKPVATKRPHFCGHRRAQKCVHRKELVAAAESKSSRGHEMQSTSRTTFFLKKQEKQHAAHAHSICIANKIASVPRTPNADHQTATFFGPPGCPVPRQCAAATQHFRRFPADGMMCH